MMRMKHANRIAGARVLVVDDSEANRRFASYALAKIGCAVSAVADGDDVVGAVSAAAAAGSPFDVVLMDLVMVCVPACAARVSVEGVMRSPPQVHMNGDTALAALRAAGWHVMVAAVTANAAPEDVERCAQRLLAAPHAAAPVCVSEHVIVGGAPCCGARMRIGTCDCWRRSMLRRPCAYRNMCARVNTGTWSRGSRRCCRSPSRLRSCGRC